MNRRGSSSSLQEGPLVASDGLASVFRLCRAIAERMPERQSELAPAAHEVSLVHLEAVERALGAELPTDVIMLSVLRIPVLVRATGLHVALLDSPTRDCAGVFGAPREWVAVASFAGRGMPDGAQTGYDTLLCTSRRCTRDGDPGVRAVDESGASAPTPLSAFVRERLAQRYATTERCPLLVQAAAEDARPVDGLAVRVVDDRPCPVPSVRLNHPKFGDGSLVRVDGEKVEVASDSGDTRTLLRKYLTPA